MKKRSKIIECKVTHMEFPNIGVCTVDDSTVKIKGAILGQTVLARIKHKRSGTIKGTLQEVLKLSDFEKESNCIHQGQCGGCTFQTLSYEKQLSIKEQMILTLFTQHNIDIGRYHGIFGSPEVFRYRNKMEFSFGDTEKDGPIALGMRKKHSYYEVVQVSGCMIADNDYGMILDETAAFFRERGYSFYNNRKHTGILRHLVVRKSKTFNAILVNLVSACPIDNEVLLAYKERLLSLNLAGQISGLLSTVNDSFADTVKLDNIRVIYGRDFFYESILGLTFKITPGSFFQTNTIGAGLLYEKVRSLAGHCDTVYDFYSGTGTITQVMAKISNKAIGVELVQEAVASAVENARRNGINNAEFICGDVLNVIDTLKEPPDLIVLDPPRDGVNSKALGKIVELNAKRIIYISCKATSLVRDLPEFLSAGYVVSDSLIVDMFPWCAHVESVVLMSRKDGLKA